MGWIEFTAAMVVFMMSHRIPAALGLKTRLTAALGLRGYTALFSVISILLLWWVIAAAGRAPFVPLWDQTLAARWAVNLIMPVVVLLACLGIAAPNPFAFEGCGRGFDPARPGIAGITRQPLLWALLLWSGVHLWANGDLAHVILFGAFAGFSGLGMKLVEQRRARQLGPARWQELTQNTSLIPFAAARRSPGFPYARFPVLRIGLAVLSWLALWHLHAPVVGVSPMP